LSLGMNNNVSTTNFSSNGKPRSFYLIMADQAQSRIEDTTGYKVKSSKHWVSGWKTKLTDKELDWKELQLNLNETAKSYLSTQSQLNHCCFCDDTCVEGYFVVETLLFIPRDNPSQRFHYQVPRICCTTCSEHELAQKEKEGMSSGDSIATINELWPKYQKQKEKEKEKDKEKDIVGIEHEKMTKSMDTTLGKGKENDQDPFEDGFLICTQLVKTGGADQGGLQVGDVLVEFGHYSKARFPGLKSIAMLVRKSCGKEIPVVIWRKLENLDSSHRTMYQKLTLKVKPLQSHDANGGGVLGAVINTYPLPQPRV